MKALLMFLALSLTKLTGIYRIDNVYPDVEILVDAPSDLNIKLKSEIIFYALPNGNSIEWTAGKLMKEGDDWHYNIQHIRAQGEFLRNLDSSKNYIIVYLKDAKRSWTSWRHRHSDVSAQVLESVISDIAALYSAYRPSISLSSHSGGGYFIFEYLRTAQVINPLIKRLIFIDSVYGYDKEQHLEKLALWLKNRHHFLSVLSYEDVTVFYNGKRLVSDDGGTWGRSHAMINDLSGFFRFSFSDEFCEDEHILCYRAKHGRISFSLVKNPDGKIYHTVLVERNGFIHSFLSGSRLENKGYRFWSTTKAYSPFIFPDPISAI